MIFPKRPKLWVPNVPCGVESHYQQLQEALHGRVPNVPCGVESCPFSSKTNILLGVPNVPCGVESMKLERFGSI